MSFSITVSFFDHPWCSIAFLPPSTSLLSFLPFLPINIAPQFFYFSFIAPVSYYLPPKSFCPHMILSFCCFYGDNKL